MFLNRDEFLQKFALTREQFEEAGLTWEELCEIAEDYAGRLEEFYHVRDMFLREFIEDKEEQAGLHSYRTRVKTPEHLVEKIIRRRVENYRKYRELSRDNYLK